MASNLSKFSGLFRLKNGLHVSVQAKFSTSSFGNASTGRKMLIATSGLIATGAVGLIYALNESVNASDLTLHPPKYPWQHKNHLFAAIDKASVRRGYEVYKQVCAACHSLKYVAYRELVNETHTEDEARAEAAEVTVVDGPDDNGKMFTRPGKLSDYFPDPYPNEEAARAANNGAHPPDLTYIIQGRHGQEDYVFSLLTGYTDTPAGVTVQEGQYFNPYFPGGAISMKQALYNEAVEYSDGTPATASQMAKDVSTFLKWIGEPFQDEARVMAIKTLMVGIVMGPALMYWKRHIWSTIKARKIIFNPKSKPN